MSRHLFRSALCLLLVSTAVSCRHPGIKAIMTVAPKSDVELSYDTAFEAELIGKEEPPEDSLNWNYKWRYRDSLAEPVAVVDWQHGVSSTWNVLYATNRIAEQDQRPGRTVRYGNHWDTTPEYGSCLVELPHRAPGETPAIKYAEPSMLDKIQQVVFRKEPTEEAAEDPFIEIGDPRRATTRDFFAQLDDQLARSRQKDVLVFVHGFNVSFESAMARTAQVAADLPFNGALVSYSWPSQGSPTKYKDDGKIVDASVGAFSEFLTELGGRLPDDVRINIVVHSMGNRLVVRALERLPRSFAQPKRFSNIVFCAPDVGVSEFKQKAPYAVKYAEHVTLYTCANDTALVSSYIVNGEERAGAPGVPLIIEGIETIECVVVDTSAMGHSYYGSNPIILRDLFEILKEDHRPEERKWMTTHTLPFGLGSYWIFQGYPVKLRWTWHFEESERAKQTRLVSNEFP